MHMLWSPLLWLPALWSLAVRRSPHILHTLISLIFLSSFLLHADICSCSPISNAVAPGGELLQVRDAEADIMTFSHDWDFTGSCLCGEPCRGHVQDFCGFGGIVEKARQLLFFRRFDFVSDQCAQVSDGHAEGRPTVVDVGVELDDSFWLAHASARSFSMRL